MCLHMTPGMHLNCILTTFGADITAMGILWDYIRTPVLHAFAAVYCVVKCEDEPARGILTQFLEISYETRPR